MEMMIILAKDVGVTLVNRGVNKFSTWEMDVWSLEILPICSCLLLASFMNIQDMTETSLWRSSQKISSRAKRELGQGEDKTMYDYYSLLHYPTTAWSKDDKSETMKPLNTQYKNIGGSGVLTATDKIKLNLRYACPEVSTGLLLDYVQEVEYRSRMQDRHLEERMKQMEDVISKLPGACNKPWISLTTGCYLFLVDQPRSWWQAQTKCYEEGGYVVEINSQKENDEITNVITSQGYKENHHEFWIGLQDGYGDGNWEWMYSKKRPSYTNWGPGEPSNRNEMCASYASNLLWNDLDCNSKVSRSYSRNALCELKKE